LASDLHQEATYCVILAEGDFCNAPIAFTNALLFKFQTF